MSCIQKRSEPILVVIETMLELELVVKAEA